MRPLFNFIIDIKLELHINAIEFTFHFIDFTNSFNSNLILFNIHYINLKPFALLILKKIPYQGRYLSKNEPMYISDNGDRSYCFCIDSIDTFFQIAFPMLPKTKNKFLSDNVIFSTMMQKNNDLKREKVSWFAMTIFW